MNGSDQGPRKPVPRALPYNSAKHTPIVDSEVLDEEEPNVASEDGGYDGGRDKCYANGHKLRPTVLDFRHCDLKKRTERLRCSSRSKAERDLNAGRVVLVSSKEGLRGAARSDVVLRVLHSDRNEDGWGGTLLKICVPGQKPQNCADLARMLSITQLLPCGAEGTGRHRHP